MKKIIALLIIVSVLFASEGTGWAFFNLFSVSTEEEVEIGRRIAASIEKTLPVYSDPAYEKRLIRAGYRLAAVSDRQDLEYTFIIIDKDEINAFATFGGYIYINKGVMDAAETDDELAAVLAHEIGHVSARHLAKRMGQDKSFSLGLFALTAFVLRKQKHGRDISRAVNTGYGIIQRGYSREDELEADRLGVRYSYRAGYSPLAAISMMKKLKEQNKERGVSLFENISILRTHPYLDDRIEEVLSEYARIKALHRLGN